VADDHVEELILVEIREDDTVLGGGCGVGVAGRAAERAGRQLSLDEDA
jgi:hypothetical protein